MAAVRDASRCDRPVGDDPAAQAGSSLSDNGVVESPHPIPLKTYRVSPRKARIELEGGAAELFLPTYFGRRRLHVPLNGLAVCDLTSPLIVDSPADDVFRQPIALPYLFTTGPATAPTLLLLFAERQRVPPLRVVAAWAPNVDLPFGWTSSRSSQGHLSIARWSLCGASGTRMALRSGGEQRCCFAQGGVASSVPRGEYVGRRHRCCEVGSRA